MKTACGISRDIGLVTVLVVACVGCADRSDSSQQTPTPALPPASERTSTATAESADAAPATGSSLTEDASSLQALAATSPHTTFGQIIDGMSGTVLAGTVSESRAVPWTKPDDIRFDETFLSEENSFVEGLFMLADGSIQHIHIENDLEPGKFRALFTIGGTEPVTLQNLYPQGYKFTFPTYENSQDSLRHSQARVAISNSLKQIALAFHNYHATFKHLPPASIYGPDGKPWHSWRVLILQFLDRDLYEEYDHSVPWDDPKNAAILKKMPQVYRDPYSQDPDQTRTRYLVISGPGTAFPINAGK